MHCAVLCCCTKFVFLVPPLPISRAGQACGDTRTSQRRSTHEGAWDNSHTAFARTCLSVCVLLISTQTRFRN
ncbi:hypothetical protein F4778DRAFT_760495 [Xylariomycetidae sp. FL2044]|nr:hypothetical protein F4778DRAFT_760495 [Xylariomycetidae sp. FL2044]